MSYIFNHHNLDGHSQPHVENFPENEEHGTYKSCVYGFIISVILTLISYWLVKVRVFSPSNLYIAIAILAFIQLLTQLIFFLHITAEKKPRLNLISFAFTITITAILVGGSLWVMYNLNYNMM